MTHNSKFIDYPTQFSMFLSTPIYSRPLLTIQWQYSGVVLRLASTFWVVLNKGWQGTSWMQSLSLSHKPTLNSTAEKKVRNLGSKLQVAASEQQSHHQ